ncbi:MAG: DMT family transporter [Rhodospirillales bacterium]|nr:DMT family transporter [Rhodospirillales bacterium]
MIMILSGGLLSVNDSIIKALLNDHMHVFEVVFFRNLFAFSVLAPLYLRFGVRQLLTQRLGYHVVRNILQAVSMTLWFWSLAYLALAEATTLGFASPVYTSIAAIIFLAEPSRPMRWAAIIIGLIGVVIFIRPGFGDINIGVWMITAASISGAAVKIMTKSLTRTDTPTTIVLYMSLILAVVSFIPALFVWTWPQPIQWAQLIAIGIMGAAAHVLATQAYKLGEVTALEPVIFTRLIWAAAIGFFAFSEVPGLWSWVGAGVIICGAMLLMRSETAGSKN